jgi:hypothetical protein
MASFTPSDLTSKERSQDPLDRRLYGPQSQRGHCGKERGIVPLPGIETRFLSHLPCGLLAIPTEVSRPWAVDDVTYKYMT